MPVSNHSLQLSDMRKLLTQLLNRVDGVYGILITDRDGVPLLKATNDKVPELATRAGFLSTFGMASDQGGKLGLGKNKFIVCLYSNYQVVHLNKLPLVVTFIASSNCNTGHILTLEEQLEPLVCDLKYAVNGDA
ncbi:ragulator complex protein LAMTOR3-A [Hetaerina americana]|uniref:ragulator complex protein LAMTOR3-A n=1 Tax=Hetaerina americana TaxID=62018 RepID=UPI003A7F120C